MLTRTRRLARGAAWLLPAALLLAGTGAMAASARAAVALDPLCAAVPAVEPANAAAVGATVDGRPDPTLAQTTAWERSTDARLVGDGDADGGGSAGGVDVPARGRITIPVVWHVLEEGPSAEEGHLTRATVRSAIKQVNRGFRGRESDEAARTPFRLELVGFTRTVNEHYFRDLRWYSATERKLKHELREGGPETLNIYTALPVAGISGWASFPQEYEDEPMLDGVVIHHGVADGSVGGQGDILTHEIGHWLGLYHTFQGGCTAPGDHVDDTPYEASAARDCVDPRDTCDAPGDDPVRNYMDYAVDVCKDQFTPDQRTRMRDHWFAWRAEESPAAG